MQMMTAVRIEEFGGPDVLRLMQVPIPAPAPGEILVKIRSAGINPVDYKIRSGKYPAVKADMLPYILGRDVCGSVEVSRADRFHERDMVFGVPGIERGGYAEYVVLKESQAALKPKSLDQIAAGAIPLAGLTAWQGLFDHGGVKEGSRVLIHAGSGGVGHFAIQLAKAKGAYVITTVSDAHVDFVKDLGADEVIDYKRQEFEEVAREIDMVFDLIGGETQEKSWSVLKKGGALISTLTAPSPDKAREYGVRATRFTVTENGAELAEIARLIDDGKVAPRVSKVFKLSQAAEAQKFLEQGHSEGKIVLDIAL